MEEDIKILEDYAYAMTVISSATEQDERVAKAIEHLIARNKELESELYCANNIISDQIDLLRDSIPKSKVREILEKLKGHNYKCNFDDVDFLQNIIIEIQELLGEED